MKAVWPSMATIAKRAGIKSEKTARAKVRKLADMGILNVKSVPSHRASKHEKQYTVFHNFYSFNFDYWIQRDIAENKSTAADFTDEAVKRSIVTETVKATLDNLPAELEKLVACLEHTGKFGNVHYFKVKPGEQIARSYVEEQFKRHGLKIAVTA